MELSSLEVVYPVIKNAIIAALPLKKSPEPEGDGVDAVADDRNRAIETFIKPKPAYSTVSEDEGVFMNRSSMASTSEGSSPNSRYSYSSSIASAFGGNCKGRNKVWSSATRNWTPSSFLSDHPSRTQSRASSFATAAEERLSTAAYYQFGPVGAAPIRRLVLVKEADRHDNRKSNNNDIHFDISPPRTPHGLVDVDVTSPCCERELCLLDKVVRSIGI